MTHPIRVKIDTGPDQTPWEIADSMFLALRGLKQSILAIAESRGLDADASGIVPLMDQFAGDTPNEKAAVELLKLRLETETL